MPEPRRRRGAEDLHLRRRRSAADALRAGQGRDHRARGRLHRLPRGLRRGHLRSLLRRASPPSTATAASASATTVQAPPVLVDAARGTSVNCRASQGKFLCAAPKLPSGTYSVLWDKTPPPEPYIDLANDSSGIGFTLEENGPPAMINVRLKATDPHGVGRHRAARAAAVRARLARRRQRRAAGGAALERADGAVQGEQGDELRQRRVPDPLRVHRSGRSGASASACSTAPATAPTRTRPEVLLGFFNRITIDSFTVTPTSRAVPGRSGDAVLEHQGARSRPASIRASARSRSTR